MNIEVQTLQTRLIVVYTTTYLIFPKYKLFFEPAIQHLQSLTGLLSIILLYKL